MAEEFVIKIIPDGVSPAGVTGAAPGAAGGNAGAIGKDRIVQQNIDCRGRFFYEK